jgi:hypothetical protein
MADDSFPQIKRLISDTVGADSSSISDSVLEEIAQFSKCAMRFTAADGILWSVLNKEKKNLDKIRVMKVWEF